MGLLRVVMLFPGHMVCRAIHPLSYPFFGRETAILVSVDSRRYTAWQILRRKLVISPVPLFIFLFLCFFITIVGSGVDTSVI